MDEVQYMPAVSIADLPVTHPSHAPCPDMFTTMDPERMENSRNRIRELKAQYFPHHEEEKTHIPERFRYESFYRKRLLKQTDEAPSGADSSQGEA